jgi:hypothetical protein
LSIFGSFSDANTIPPRITSRTAAARTNASAAGSGVGMPNCPAESLGATTPPAPMTVKIAARPAASARCT